MTITKESTLPSKDEVNSYVDRLYNELKINDRLHEIGRQCALAFRESYKIEDEISITYSCLFTPEKKIKFKLKTSFGFEILTPDMDMSCLWAEPDIHIAINMMKSDFTDDFVKLRNAARELDKNTEPTLWERIRSWF